MPDQATEAALANAAATLAGDFIKDVISRSGRLAATHILPHLKDFETYYSSTYRKCSSVKLIIDRDEVHAFSDIYVKGSYVVGDHQTNDDGLAQLVRDNHRILVQGLGGIGKTMLLKYIWIALFRESGGRLPVFVELRRVNEFKAPDIQSYIRRSLTPSGNSLSEAQFSTLLKSGRFIFLFDAFDEVADEIRPSIERQILDLAHDYPACGILVSGRHDIRFGSWETFRVFQAQPFKKKQIEEVIDKVPFDNKVKTKFLSTVIKKQYETYESFLSTPLLAIMMLITYEQFADIPEKVHIFYKYAFQTLYTLHDAGKETFRRSRKSGLSEDEFCRVFAIFCLASYMKRGFIFVRSSLVEEIRLAARRANVEVDVDKFLLEVCESVNLMYEEGQRISFTHRSFQEYFAADALTTHLSSVFDLLGAKIPLNPGDSVFRMTYDMNSDLVEEKFLIPTWERYQPEVRELLNGGDVWQAAKLLGLGMMVFPTRSSSDDRRPGAGTEFFCASEFAEFIKRGLAFLPETADIDWTDHNVYFSYGHDVRKLVRALAKLSGWTQRSFPDFSHVSIHRGLCEFEADDDAGSVRRELPFVDIERAFRESGQAMKVLEAEVRYQRGLVVALDKAMRRVRSRTKDRVASLEELLGPRVF